MLWVSWLNKAQLGDSSAGLSWAHSCACHQLGWRRAGSQWPHSHIWWWLAVGWESYLNQQAILSLFTRWWSQVSKSRSKSKSRCTIDLKAFIYLFFCSSNTKQVTWLSTEWKLETVAGQGTKKGNDCSHFAIYHVQNKAKNKLSRWYFIPRFSRCWSEKS